MLYLITFLEGLISFLSPCFLPMLPVYLAYFAGDAEDGANDRRTLLHAGLFVIGFSAVFILLGLGAAVFYATVILLNKFIKNVEGIHRTFLQFLSAIVILIPYVAMTSGVTLGNLDGAGWANLFIVGFVHTGVTYCMYFSALKELPGQKAAILSYIDPLVAVLVSVTILGEPMTLWQGVGGILILGFTLWNEISPRGKP